MNPQDADKLLPAKAAPKHALFEPMGLGLLSLATAAFAAVRLFLLPMQI